MNGNTLYMTKYSKLRMITVGKISGFLVSSVSLTCSEFIETQQNMPIHTIIFIEFFILKISFESSEATTIHIFNILLSVTCNFLLFF